MVARPAREVIDPASRRGDEKNERSRVFFKSEKARTSPTPSGRNRAVRTCLGREASAFKEVVDFFQLEIVQIPLQAEKRITPAMSCFSIDMLDEPECFLPERLEMESRGVLIKLKEIHP